MGNYKSNSTKSDYSDGKRKITPKMIYDHFEKPAKQSIWACPLMSVLFTILALIIDETVLSVVLYFFAVLFLVMGCLNYFSVMKMLKNGEWKAGWQEFCQSVANSYRKYAYQEVVSERQQEIFAHFLDCQAHTDVWREIFPTKNLTNEK